jgi:hypothetical protein
LACYGLDGGGAAAPFTPVHAGFAAVGESPFSALRQLRKSFTLAILDWLLSRIWRESNVIIFQCDRSVREFHV